MDLIRQVLTEVLGSYKASFYITYFIFVLLGVLLSLRIGAMKRDKESNNTPFKFTWSFLIQDKALRIVTSMAVVFVAIRFGEEIFHVIPTYPAAIALGLGFDQALIVLEKFQFKAREK